ncbi:SseB family protein, partial [Litorisediminicola beolgyonensis]
MTEETALDRAFTEMEAGDDAARLRFYAALADSELFLLLAREAEGETLEPELFDLGDARFVLVFDREDRLSGFTGRPSPYAALPGRVVAQMLAGQGIGLGLNLEDAPSATLLPPEAMGWLVETLDHGPTEAALAAAELSAPGTLPETLLTALDARL